MRFDLDRVQNFQEDRPTPSHLLDQFNGAPCLTGLSLPIRPGSLFRNSEGESWNKNSIRFHVNRIEECPRFVDERDRWPRLSPRAVGFRVVCQEGRECGTP